MGRGTEEVGTHPTPEVCRGLGFERVQGRGAADEGTIRGEFLKPLCLKRSTQNLEALALL